MLESDIKGAARDYLLLTGWFTFPIMQGMGSYHGIPDRYAIKNGIEVWIEFKRPGGKQSEKQKIFQSEIERHGGHYILAESIDELIEKLKERGNNATVSAGQKR
jgi:hypothetical protein